MFLYTVGYALFLAVVLTLLFSSLFRSSGPWNNFWINAIILFLVLWGVGLWLAPVGPVYYGVAWVDLLVVGLLLALLLAATEEAGRRRYRQYPAGEEVDIVAESKKEAGATALFGVFFWIFVVFSLVIILAGIFS